MDVRSNRGNDIAFSKGSLRAIKKGRQVVKFWGQKFWGQSKGSDPGGVGMGKPFVSHAHYIVYFDALTYDPRPFFSRMSKVCSNELISLFSIPLDSSIS